MGKVEHNKRQKRDSLLDSAFSLFINNGFTNTSISDIVKRAGVAKGTFYLYFRDKYDIRNHLITGKANQVFQAAYAEMTARGEATDFEDQVLFMADHILNQLAANHSLVMLLSKHLSWGSFKNFLAVPPGGNTPAIYTTFESMLSKAGHRYRNPKLMMYLILELLSGTSFNAILYKQPVPLEELKPHLYETVKSILKNYRED